MQNSDYDKFIEEFAGRMQRDHSDSCFYVYGSFARGDYKSERESDIDGGIILDSGIVTSKDEVLDISRILAECLARHRVPIQFNLTDRGSNKDGRFLSYTRDYTDHIKSRGKVLAGIDYTPEMNGIDYRSGVLNSVAYNFRKVRNNMLASLDNQANNEEEFDRCLRKSIDLVVKIPKKIIWLHGRDETVEDADEARKILRDVLPGVDTDEIEMLDRLRHMPRNDVFWVDKERGLRLYARALDAFEKMLEAYTEKFPVVSKREARHLI